MSADFDSIMRNEGMIYEGLSGNQIEQRRRDELSRVKSARFRPVTSRGVRLGMSEHRVLSILGKPTKAIWSKRFKARELIYRVQTRLSKDGVGQSASNYYLFRGGKLYYVELSRNKIGGA